MPFNIFTNIEDESGKLTLNVGFVEMNSKTNFIGCDFRVPVHTDVNVILKKLEASLAPYNLVIEQVILKEKLFFDKNSLIVKKLLNVYQQATNDMSQPLAIGGRICVTLGVWKIVLLLGLFLIVILQLNINIMNKF
ncbi:hypothetical protein [Spiroplasma endosymbiont of Agriotes lineatus]|uniref:hypothetical protein n=1 Tax=Spiroplasma endosymbiont of Agriotes lineatus TaxID=3077930 RepID=UPI0030CD5425